ncbi:hypothetical protein RVR_5800 [Actinacidiphila reveromycinica]|uniref:DUF2637 domain-containing protein n=1 Tax=Actinacidiphila reveromycinica TaxID=659352 RepID=A0A7U3VQ45_9ACTN|nr:hypothetical protein [Streptomyces sp. SN-593]BBA99259.1 hypothetical protein RVR_5800 [Streptomyces sp. SN-593]
MTRTGAGWRLALFVVSVAALATTGWSLYAVARHYQAPQGIAGAAVAVFDGIAYACLHLASDASANGRSAFGPRLTALAMASTSVYLNINHAHLIHGGRPAAVFFAVPTLGLLAVSEMSWAGPRAARRAELGERPYRPPVFGGIAWVLAPMLAGRTVKARAVDHIEHGGRPAPSGAAPRSATEVLRSRFAEMDPGDAVRIAHDAQPGLPPAELAALLVTYGVIVDAVQVALVLSDTQQRITVERGDAPGPEADAVQVGELPPVTLTGAIVDAAAELGPEAKSADIASLVEMRHRITVDDGYVRTVLHRESKKAAGDVGQGGGGYA